jgi:hypothetical protein
MGLRTVRCMRWFLAAGVLGALAAALVLAGAGGLRSEAQDGVHTVVLRQGEAGYTGCTDVRISANRPDTNFADGELILGESGRINTLIRFDVSSIVPYAIVEEATLGLQVSNHGQNVPSIVCGAYPVSRTWDEVQATWNQASTGHAWGTPGCNDTLTDRSAVPAGVTTVTTPAWYTWDVTSVVQRWIAEPEGNHGLLLSQLNPEVLGEADTRESEYPGIDVRPSLTIKYRLVPPTPTPYRTPLHLPCQNQVKADDVQVVFQKGADYEGVQDTWLAFDDRETFNDQEWYIHIGYRSHDSGLIRFDVSSIPRGSTVVCGVLGLYAERWSGGPLEIGAYQVRRASVIPQASWTWASAGMAWAQGGCNGTADRSPAAHDTVVVDHILDWYYFDLTSLVDDWVNGRSDNLGLSLQQVGEFDPDTVWFTSSEDGEFAKRPMLAIFYRLPSGPSATRTASPTATRTTTAVATATRTATPGASTTVILQVGADGYVASSDARISSMAPSVNYGAANLRVGNARRLASLVRFDLGSRVPAGATIKSATLSVFGYYRDGSTAVDTGAYAVYRLWEEHEATWISARALVPWDQPGCESAVTDRAATVSDHTMMGLPGWYSFLVTDDVQRWLDAPANNNGWLLRAISDQATVVYFYSAEHNQANLRPKLQITYTLP